MTTMLLVRHGQSAANIEGIFAGHSDAPLTALGERQAACTCAFLAENYAVDAIYSSDLTRARRTVQPLADRLGLSITPVQAMREIFAGEWEGRRFEELQAAYPVEYTRWLTDIGHAAPVGGESIAALSDRVETALQKIAEENDGRTVVVATHATPIRTLQCRLQGQSIASVQEVNWVTNASVTAVTYAAGQWTLVEANIDAHLDGLRSSLPANV